MTQQFLNDFRVLAVGIQGRTSHRYRESRDSNSSSTIVRAAELCRNASYTLTISWPEQE